MNRIELTAHDGKRISVCVWDDVVSPIAVIQISHGMAEHAMRYESFANHMNGKGFIVIADDHRAHGQTDFESLGYCDGDIFADTLLDMKMLNEYAKNTYSLPVVLFGHSYGSFLSQAYLENYSDTVSGIILGGSSYMKTFINKAGKLIAKMGRAFKGAQAPAYLMKKMSFDAYEKKLGGSFISSIKEEAERYNSDELCGFICSYNFYWSMFNNVLKLYDDKKLKEVKIPVLLISGCNDPVSNLAVGVSKLYDVYSDLSLDVSVCLQEGVRHEYLNDVKKDEALCVIETFAKQAVNNG